MTRWIRRLVRVMPLAFAIWAVACKPAKSPELTQREIARGAVQGLAWGVRLSVEVCARAVVAMDDRGDARADELYNACVQGWDVAHASLLAADAIIDAREAWDAGKVACLANRSLEALAQIMAGLRKVDAKMDADIQTTIDDGIALGRYLVRMAPGGSCPMPKAKPAAAPAPSVSL